MRSWITTLRVLAERLVHSTCLGLRRIPRQPLVPVLAAVSLGAVLTDGLPGGPGSVLLTAGLLSSFAVGLRLLRIAPRLRGGLVAATIVLLTAVWPHLRPVDPDELDWSQLPIGARLPVCLEGRIASPVQSRAGSDRLEFELLLRRIGQQRLPASGRLLCRIISPDESDASVRLRVGDRVWITGQLMRPGGVRNPGEFEWAEYLASRGLDAVVDSWDAGGLVRMPLLSDESERGWSVLWERWRAELRESTLATITERHRATVDALLFGWRGGIPRETVETFRRTGTSHLLAISGLHVGMLVSGILVLLRIGSVSPARRSVVLLLVIAVYLGVTRSAAPVQRAAVLAAAWAVGYPANRYSGLANRLALAGSLILWADPAALLQPAAQLSFLAVAALGWAACGSDRWQAERESIRVRELLRQSIAGRVAFRVGLWGRRTLWPLFAVWLVTAPLVMHSFHLLSVSGLVANVVAVPLMGLGLTLGFCQLLLVAVSCPCPPLAKLWEASLDALLGWVRWCEQWRWGWSEVTGPGLWLVVLFYVGFAIAVLLDCGGRRPFWGRILVLAMVPAGLLHHQCSSSHAADVMRVTWLDVGHGAAIFLELPGGKTMLYDAGSIRSPARAARAVQGLLRDRGLRSIDVLIVSHADADHCNGVPMLLRGVAVGEVLLPPQALDRTQQIITDLLLTASDRGTPVRTVAAGDRLLLDEQVLIEAYHPRKSFVGQADNESSLVLKVAFGASSILLTGDLEGGGLDELLKSSPHLSRDRIEILQVPHHGSLSAEPERLGEWLKPDYAIVTCSDRVQWEALSSRFAASCRVWSTARSGAILLIQHRDGRREWGHYASVPW